MLAPPLEADRRLFQSRTRCRFVDARQFRSLALSNRRLERADDPASDLRGLIDPDTGIRYVIEAEKLETSLR